MSQLAILAAAWKFGSNDPSFIAWLIFGAYFFVGFLCWRAGFSSRSSQHPQAHRLWRLLATALFLLGLNKQLDLHQLALELVQDATENGNLTRDIRIGIVIIAGVIGLLTLLLVHKCTRGSTRQSRRALVTIIVLLALQVLRFLPSPVAALLLSHVFTAEGGLLHIHVIEIFELACIIVIGIFAVASVREVQTVAPTSID
jgi:hypothetical protein